jgi:SAM-dependent methyltransferase
MTSDAANPEKVQAACALAEIATLDVSMFDTEDHVNIILQRSEILWDEVRPGRAIRAWSNGDSAPLLEIATRRGEDIARRAAAVAWLEWRDMLWAFVRRAPASIADIGCGYAMADLFAYRDFGARLMLIDIEAGEERHFGFAETGAAYTSLDRAQAFLLANGVPARQIEAVNPQKQDLAAQAPVDLALSMLSCGFHYPSATYADFYANGVAPGGAVVLDVRARRAGKERAVLKAVGAVEEIGRGAAHLRLMARKADA